MAAVVERSDDTYQTADSAAKKWAFEIPPEPIPDRLIHETVTADVVVVGEGMAGLCTALSAAEEGVDTVIVTGSSRPIGRGGSVFAAYSKIMEAKGYPRQEVESFYLQEFAASSYNIDQRKWYRFYNNSETAMNWLIDMLEAEGFDVVLEQGTEDDPFSPSDQPVGTHAFLGHGISFAGVGIYLALNTLEKNFKERGGRIAYSTVAKQLVRNSAGQVRVSAVIALDQEGRYIRYQARKAVVLATGDFSANREMMAKYCPTYAKYYTNDTVNYNAGFVEGGLMKGDGHLMALWAGAAWQKTFPNAPLIQGSRLCSNMPYGSHRGLRINRNGERFCNEDCNAPYTALTVLREPGQVAYALWGTNYAYEVEWLAHGAARGGRRPAPEEIIRLWEKDVAGGMAVKGETIGEVIKKLGLPPEETRATVDRYNGHCRNRHDADFHKKAKYLQEIREAPFYGGRIDEFHFFSVLGGPRTNHKMQICDENDEPIKGLYAVGTIAGDMFANCYNFRIAGHNYGCCLTFGYLTGKHIARCE